jgi:hypothetical protein
MASGADVICVLDSLAKRIVVPGWDGRFRYAFGADATSKPGNIAVSRDNLVFVSDNFKHVLKVYRAGIRRASALLMAEIGDFGIEPGSFKGIAGFSVDDDFHFVADSLNARVQIMLINSSALDAGK